MTDKREWTVAEVQQLLAQTPNDAKVRLLDADTFWTITKFNIVHDVKTNELWFFPCDFSVMVKT